MKSAVEEVQPRAGKSRVAAAELRLFATTPVTACQPVRRVAIFEPYLFDEAYGNQKLLIGLAKYCDRFRVSLTLVAQSPTSFLDDFRAAGGQAVVVPAPTRLRRFSGVLTDGGLLGAAVTAAASLRYSLSLARFLTAGTFDVVQCHNLRGMLLAGPAGRAARVPVVWYVKGALINPRLDAIGFALADKILFQSHLTRQRAGRALARHSHKVGIVPNGIDVEEIGRVVAADGLRDELRLTSGVVNVAYVGQLSAVKGVRVLVDALRPLAVRRLPIRLFLIGGSCTPDHEAFVNHLEAHIRRLPAGSVQMLGFRRDALSILSLMDVLVLPSFGEGVPRSVLEAMYLSKAVVATDVGGLSELIVPGESGLIVPAGDAAALRAALETLASSTQLRKRLGANARLRVRGYSIERTARGLEDVHAQLASGTDGGGACTAPGWCSG